MIWNTQTQDANVMQFVEGDGDHQVVLGIVRDQGGGKFMASTQKKYLGMYPNLKFAQKAVEVEVGKEVKGSGRIIVAGGI